MPFDLNDRGDIDRALKQVSDTRVIEIGPGAIRATPRVFRECFGASEAVLVADTTTMCAAGVQVGQTLQDAGIGVREPIVFDEDPLEAAEERGPVHHPGGRAQRPDGGGF